MTTAKLGSVLVIFALKFAVSKWDRNWFWSHITRKT
jgi:hypothetical protein